jgi:hypothetical protein
MMDDMLEKKKEPKGIIGGIYTEDSGLPPPQDIDGGSAPPPPKKPKKMAKGGVTRGDGCITKGHTRGTMVRMAGA